MKQHSALALCVAMFVAIQILAWQEAIGWGRFRYWQPATWLFFGGAGGQLFAVVVWWMFKDVDGAIATA